jgi:hypothetical protein
MEKSERNEIVASGLAMGLEFAVIVIVFLFIGHFVGQSYGEFASMVGMAVGANIGLVFAVYQIRQRAKALVRKRVRRLRTDKSANAH